MDSAAESYFSQKSDLKLRRNIFSTNPPVVETTTSPGRYKNFPETSDGSHLLVKQFSSSWSSAVLVSIIVLDLSLLFDDVLFCLPFCWCPCMAINVSVQYDGGFLPDIILLTQCYYHRGTRLNAMKRFCIFSY